MTKKEKIIVSAYTGVLMCDFSDLHEYIEKKLRRPVFTHELASKDIQKEIREKTKDDFLSICATDTDDLISRSALIKEMGDPGDGMIWPTKEGFIAFIEKFGR